MADPTFSLQPSTGPQPSTLNLHVPVTQGVALGPRFVTDIIVGVTTMITSDGGLSGALEKRL